MNKLTRVVIIIVLIVLFIMTGVYIWLNRTMEMSTKEIKNSISFETNIKVNNFLNVALATVDNTTKNTDENKAKEVSVLAVNNNITSQTNEAPKTLPIYKATKYGTSENGRDLMYYSLAPENYENTLLFVFAIHGYEDAYDKDGKVLVDTAKYLVDYYKNSDASLLYNNRLLIVECANPDGLYDGKSCNGYGRCNAKGIDLNRDFDVIHKAYTNSRNYTPAPFSGKESKALADLIKAEKPVVVIDFHGWENCTIGDSNLAKIFRDNMSLKHKTDFNNNCNGYLSYWAHTQGASALLVEFKNDNISRSNLKMAVDEVLETF